MRRRRQSPGAFDAAGAMSGSRHIFIVCSPRANVGKTLVARLIAEFYDASARPVSAFDLEPFEPALAEFLPALATRQSLTDTRSQTALFDRWIPPLRWRCCIG